MISGRPKIREYHFDGTNRAQDWTLVGNATVTSATVTGGLAFSDAGQPSSWAYFNNRLVFDIDKIDFVEFLCQITNFNDDAAAWFGLVATYNVAPASWAQFVTFKIGGAAVSSERPIYIDYDDGTNDATQQTGFYIAEDTWKRFRLDFKTGVLTQSPPSQSLGGKSSIRYSITDSNLGYQQTEQPSAHINMSNYSGGLQLIWGTAQTSGTQSDASLIVDHILVGYQGP